MMKIFNYVNADCHTDPSKIVEGSIMTSLDPVTPPRGRLPTLGADHLTGAPDTAAAGPALEDVDFSGTGSDDDGPRTLNDEARAVRSRQSNADHPRTSRGQTNGAEGAAAGVKKKKKKKKKKTSGQGGESRRVQTAEERADRASHPFAPQNFHETTRAHEQLGDDDLVDGNPPPTGSDLARTRPDPLLSSSAVDAREPTPRKKHFAVLNNTGFQRTRGPVPTLRRQDSSLSAHWHETSGANALRLRIEWILEVLCRRAPSILLGFILCFQVVTSSVLADLGSLTFFLTYQSFAITTAALLNFVNTLTLLGVADAIVRGGITDQPSLVLAGAAAAFAYIVGLVMLSYEIRISVYSVEPHAFVINNGTELKSNWVSATDEWDRQNGARTGLVVVSWLAHYVAREM